MWVKSQANRWGWPGSGITVGTYSGQRGRNVARDSVGLLGNKGNKFIKGKKIQRE